MGRTKYPKEIYLSPCFSMKRFIGLREKYGDEQALTNTRFKAEREMWITGAFLLGKSKHTNQQYWLQANPDETAPDTFAISPSVNEEGAVGLIHHIEIFEYEGHNKGSIVEAIQKKLSKGYPDYYFLVCYVHGRAGEEFKHKEISETIKSLNPKVSEIWIVASVQSDNPTDYAVLKLFPNGDVILFDYEEECRNNNQVDMIKVARGYEKEIRFERIGKGVLKLP